jgi:hypothetical protein
MSLSNEDLGRAAYEAYAQAVDNTSVRGDDLWRWSDLPQRVALAWITAAIAVKTRVAIEERAQRESETER